MNAADKGSRRRSSERARLRLDRSVVAPAVVVLLAAAAVLLTLPPSTSGRAGSGVPATTAGSYVDHTAFACPDQDAGKRVETAVRLGLAPAADGQQPPDGGSVRQGPVASGAQPVDVARAAGWSTYPAPGDRRSTPPAVPRPDSSGSAPTSRRAAPWASRPAPCPARSGGSPAPAPGSTTPRPCC